MYNYRLNPFVKVFQKEGIYALYNILSLETVYFKKDSYDSELLSPSQVLIDKYFFVPVDFNSVQYFNEFANNSSKKAPSIDVVYFLVTSECNYNCKYCFIESRFESAKKSYMSIETATKAIDLIKRNTNKVKIIFYGGEPLLNFEVIQYVVNKIRQTSLECHFSIITNGSIMTDRILSFLKDNKFNVSVSLDGLERINDKSRIDLKGNGTFNRIISTIEKLKSCDIRLGISCTINPYNLQEITDIFDIIKKYKINGLGYNFMTKNPNLSFSTEEITSLPSIILKSEDFWLHNGVIEDKIIKRKLIPYVEGNIAKFRKDCAGYGNQVVITPHGNVGVCHGLWPDMENNIHKTYYDIDVDYKDSIIEHNIWKEWNVRTPFNMPQCWNCIAIGACGGGCAKNSFIETGSIWNLDENTCKITKEVIEWMVWKYYEMKIK